MLFQRNNSHPPLLRKAVHSSPFGSTFTIVTFNLSTLHIQWASLFIHIYIKDFYIRSSNSEREKITTSLPIMVCLLFTQWIQLWATGKGKNLPHVCTRRNSSKLDQILGFFPWWNRNPGMPTFLGVILQALREALFGTLGRTSTTGEEHVRCTIWWIAGSHSFRACALHATFYNAHVFCAVFQQIIVNVGPKEQKMKKVMGKQEKRKRVCN